MALNMIGALMLASAQAMDTAGIDRVVVSDHVVFGENLELCRSFRGWCVRRPPTHWARRKLAGTPYCSDGDRGHHRADQAGDVDTAGRPAAARGPSKTARDTRCALRGPSRSRRRRGLAG